MIKRTTWIILGIFVIVLLAFLIWQNFDQEKTASATPTAGVENALDLAGSTISGFQLEQTGGSLIQVAQGDDGAWILSPSQNQPLDVERIQSIIDDLISLRMVSKLDNPPAEEIVGLDPAEYRLVIQLKDGKEQVVLIGTKTPVNDGYYAELEDGTLVVLDTYGLDPVLELLTSPPILPTPTASFIPSIQEPQP
jgi:Domain of unknown function (DUF4340)